ncbi:hypothetical protein [Spirochaeta dissipatitropha]
MKSITVHGIDDILESKLKEKSKEYKLSQNKTVKFLLEEALSIKGKRSGKVSFRLCSDDGAKMSKSNLKKESRTWNRLTIQIGNNEKNTIGYKCI